MAQAMLTETRYRLRKRGAACGTTVAAGVGVGQDFDLEALLIEHEESGIREREEKRRRREQATASALATAALEPIPLTSLPGPCIGRVMEMIGSAQDLYSFVHTCRYVMSHFDHPDAAAMVLRAAAFEDAGKKSAAFRRSVVDSVVDGIRSKTVHIPSPMRLLRLVLAKTCERGDRCYGFNLETRSAVSLARESARPFALAVCDKCLKASSVGIGWGSNFTAASQAPCVARFRDRMPHPELALGLTDRDGKGEGKNQTSCGPVIHARHIHQIATTYAKNDDDQRLAVDRLVDQLYGEDGSAERGRYDSAADALVELWEATKSDVAAYLALKKRQEEEEREARRNERVAKRIATCQVILDELLSHFERAPGLLDLVSAVTWHPSSEFACLEFHCGYVDAEMRNVIRAPSSVTPRHVAEIAATIRKNITLLFESSLLDISWLLSQKASTAPMKTAIREYCLEHFTDKRVFATDRNSDDTEEIIMPSPRKWLDCKGLDSHFFRLLDQKQEIAAIVRVLLHTNGALSEIFARAVVPDQSSHVAKYRSLAKKVWSKKASTVGLHECSTDEDFKTIYMSCRSEYERLAEGAKRYLAHPATRAFTRELPSSSPSIPAGRTFTRLDAVNQIFSPRLYRSRGDAVTPYDHLLSRNFEALLAIHRRYFFSPLFHGF